MGRGGRERRVRAWLEDGAVTVAVDSAGVEVPRTLGPGRGGPGRCGVRHPVRHRAVGVGAGDRRAAAHVGGLAGMRVALGEQRRCRRTHPAARVRAASPSEVMEGDDVAEREAVVGPHRHPQAVPCDDLPVRPWEGDKLWSARGRSTGPTTGRPHRRAGMDHLGDRGREGEGDLGQQRDDVRIGDGRRVPDPEELGIGPVGSSGPRDRRGRHRQERPAVHVERMPGREQFDSAATPLEQRDAQLALQGADRQASGPAA